MEYIKGKYRKSIFEGNSGYKVGLFRVVETNSEDIETNRTITFTGYFPELNTEDNYIFKGKLVYHDKYGEQFEVSEFEKSKPEEKDSILEFLTSSLIKGCGIKTAERIYELYGNDCLNKIRENKDNLLLVQGITDKRADSIYSSVVKYFKADDDLIFMKSIGFSIKEAMYLISVFEDEIRNIINNNIYDLIEYIDFKKLDSIFLANNKREDERRVKACIIQSMKELTFATGDIYLDKVEIVTFLYERYFISSNINNQLEELYLNKEIVIENEDYYLSEDYLDESNIASCINDLLKKKVEINPKFDELIKKIEKDLKIKYNEEQINAIKNSLNNHLSIITGGPGTGKTTIIKGIIELYKRANNINDLDNKLLLLAPTGRAARRMCETTNFPASTIHRFLKWDKEDNTFNVNEFNKEHYDLIIVDESSMLDNHLLSSLFKGISLNTTLIFVGDEYQLPSVGPGNVLSDMINSDVISHISLNNIYRQSDNSFIPVLASEIKNNFIREDILSKKDDYSFISCSNDEIKGLIIKILEKIKEKNISEHKVQVLAPMYKGINGIDNLNVLLQGFYNGSGFKNEFKHGSRIFRDGDKILNLVNDIDNNISNGDIGYIEYVSPYNKDEVLVINYDGNSVSYKRDMLNTITHAYAITIHKSQGSEFEHVIMPLTNAYSRMLYNKLLYTGVSRAKKSLVIIGEKSAFETAVNNNYSLIRKTTLKQKILNNNKKVG